MTTTVTVSLVTPLGAVSPARAYLWLIDDDRACVIQDSLPQARRRTQKRIRSRRDAGRIIGAHAKPRSIWELAVTSAPIHSIALMSLSARHHCISRRIRSQSSSASSHSRTAPVGPRLVVRVDSRVQRFHQNTHHAPKHCSDGHGRHKDAAWHFGAVRNDDEAGADDYGEKERVEHAPLFGCSCLSAFSTFKIIAADAALAAVPASDRSFCGVRWS